MQIAIIAICIFLLFRIQAIVYRKLWDWRLNVQVRFQQERVTEGEIFVLEEVLENRKWLPLPVIFLQFKLSKHFQVVGEKPNLGEDRYSRNELLSVMMNQRYKRKLEVICRKRGQYRVERASLVSKSLFLDEEYNKSFQCDGKITVYPRMVDTRRFEDMLQSTNGGQVLKPFSQEDPFLIRGIREYEIYDSMRSINWKATARTGSLKVNLVDTVTSRQAFVFLNIQKESLAVHNEVLEESIRLAKTFCGMFSKKGMKSALYTNGTNGESMDAICVKKGVGPEYMNRVNEALTQIFIDETGNIVSHGREEEFDFVENYASMMENCAPQGQLVLISNNQHPSLIKSLQKLHRQGQQFLWVIPVANMQDYKDVPELKGHMRIWRMNFEGAKDTMNERGKGI